MPFELRFLPSALKEWRKLDGTLKGQFERHLPNLEIATRSSSELVCPVSPRLYLILRRRIAASKEDSRYRETTGNLLRGPLLQQRAPQDEDICLDDLREHEHPRRNPIGWNHRSAGYRLVCRVDDAAINVTPPGSPVPPNPAPFRSWLAQSWLAQSWLGQSGPAR